MKKIGIVGTRASILLTSMMTHAQGKEPELGVVVKDEPTLPPHPVVSVCSKTAVTGDKKGWQQRQTKNRKHLQIGSYKFKSKK